MAKVTTPQEVPSELLDGYRATLGEVRPDTGVRKRYPYRVPAMQTGPGHPSQAQRAQRARFLTAISNFNDVTWPGRQRWYAARPVWGSFLWYYDYIIMSELSGNADANTGGYGVIKSIQHKIINMPAAGGEGQVAITAIDPTKAVVMLFGSSLWVYEAEAFATTGTVYPYLSSLAAELVKCKWASAGWGGNDTQAADISIIVIEYV